MSDTNLLTTAYVEDKDDGHVCLTVKVVDIVGGKISADGARHVEYYMTYREALHLAWEILGVVSQCLPSSRRRRWSKWFVGEKLEVET